jgi:hypothetical protein
LYWVDTLDKEKTSEAMANKYSLANFQWISEEKWLEDGICDPDSQYYSKTCKTLKNYMWDVKNLLKSTNVIDVETLIDWKNPIMCEKQFFENILYCGLLWDDIFAKKRFVNTIYNEYMWYRLFVSYYTYEMSIEPWYSEFLDWDKWEKLDRNQEKIYSFREQVSRSRQWFSLALRSLSEISSSFAIHIWFLMYQEDVQLFMKNIAKIYPPIRTLYDKLRNVQKPD